MVSELRKQSMAWMETDYSKHTYFRWKIKWRLEHVGALGSMGDTAPLRLFADTFALRLLLFLNLYPIYSCLVYLTLIMSMCVALCCVVFVCLFVCLCVCFCL